MPQFQQVSGGACALTMYKESSPGYVAPGTKGVRLALYSEGFKRGSSKKPRTVINGKRGAGKPYTGMPQISGQLESAAYAPQLGHLLRALCGAAATQACQPVALASQPVQQLGPGFVGLACPAHGYVQDTVISISGTLAYDGVYRVGPGTTPDMLALAAPYVPETIAAGAKAHRGRVALLEGPAKDMGGTVALPVQGGVHALNEGEQVNIAGTVAYDGVYTLQAGTDGGWLVILATFEAEDFDGTATATPNFFAHTFTLPKRQPTVCMEKYLDFEDGAATNPYRRYGFCKVNGLSFSFGGDDELKFSLEFAVGREESATQSMDANPQSLPAVTMDNIETSVFVAGQRRGDVQNGSFNNAFGIEAKAAAGDLGQYSRMPEGDPDCKANMSVFLETDELQQLADARSTVPFALAICAATGDAVTFHYPEAELDAEGAAISGKEGLMQDFTVLAFVDRGQSVLRVELINRVLQYA